jgi:hypothetical protein
MAEESLRITITADNKDAVKKIQDTILALDGVEKAGKSAGGATQKLGKDFTGISRVIQDLPYGFNAISNNLTQLVPAAGAAGLAFSALVAGLSFAQIGLSNWTRGAKESDEAMKKSTEVLTDFLTNVQSSKSAFDQARAGVISKEEALKKYNDTLGSSIGYARTENEAMELMVKNTDAFVKALNLRTQAQIIYGKAANVAAKIATGEVFDQSIFDQMLMGVEGFFKGGIGSFGQIVANENAKALTQAKKDIEMFNKLGDSLMAQSIETEEKITSQRQTSYEEQKKLEEKKRQEQEKSRQERLAKEKKLLQELEAAEKAFFDRVNQLEKQKQDRYIKRSKGEFDLIKPKSVDPTTGQEFDIQKNSEAFTKRIANIKLLTTANGALNQVYEKMSENEELRLQREELANKLTDVAMNSLTGLVNAMANGQSVGQALGDMFKNLAIQIALAAAKAAIFQGILALLPGGAAAGAAGATKKGGGFLKMFSSLLGFSEGGTVSGPKSGYPVMLHGTEHIVRPDQMRSIIASASQMGGGNSRVIVEGRISGQDIWLSQQRTNTFRALTT